MDGGTVLYDSTSFFAITKAEFVLFEVLHGNGDAVKIIGQGVGIDNSCAFHCEAAGTFENGKGYGKFSYLISRHDADPQIHVNTNILFGCPHETLRHFEGNNVLNIAPFWFRNNEDLNDTSTRGQIMFDYNNFTDSFINYKFGIASISVSLSLGIHYSYWTNNKISEIHQIQDFLIKNALTMWHVIVF
jgi:hypothetical protein